jgi:hypothetical protein
VHAWPHWSKRPYAALARLTLAGDQTHFVPGQTAAPLPMISSVVSGVVHRMERGCRSVTTCSRGSRDPAPFFASMFVDRAGVRADTSLHLET